MADIKPFRGFRPKPDLVEKVAALPYDVSSAEEVKSKSINPYSFYHITRSEIDVVTGTLLNSKEVYEKAKENLDNFIQQGILIQDEQPCYYLYTISMDGRYQTGLVCLSSLDDYEKGLIKKHEFTRPNRVKDRVDNIMATGAHTGLVFLAYKEHKTIDQIIKSYCAEHNAIYDFISEDGVGHRIWVLNDTDLVNQISQIFKEEVDATYIADGHHRSAAALDAAQLLNSENANYYMTCIFPDTEVHIMDYNRLVKDLNDLDAEDFLAVLSKNFDIIHTENAYKPTKAHEFGMFLDGKWYCILAKGELYENANSIDQLDVSILQNHLLSPILQIGDPRLDERLDFAGGIRGLQYLEEQVNSGDYAVAFACYPVTMQELFEVADSGNVMPPKSTWFEPKTRDGLVLHKFI